MKLTPCKRIGELKDIGWAAVWLTSDASDYVIGRSMLVDGGMTLFRELPSGG